MFTRAVKPDTASRDPDAQSHKGRPPIAHTRVPAWTGVLQRSALGVSQPGDALELEADRAADAAIEGADVDMAASAPHGDTVHRVPGDVTSVNMPLLTLFLSSYESGPLVPAAATTAYLAEPRLLALAVRLRDVVLARPYARPMTVEQFMQQALGITSHRGTALLLCHNVSKAFARGSVALNQARLAADTYYQLFSPASFGREDTGDWYHYFVNAVPAYYTAAGAFTADVPDSVGEGVGMSQSVRRGTALAFTDAVQEALRDPAVPASAAYAAWRRANALSFLEGGIWGHNQPEVVSESRIHLRGATAGIAHAGGAVDPAWLWRVPIFKGIGDGNRPNPDQVLRNFQRLRTEGVEPFTFSVLDTVGNRVRAVNTTVPPPPGPPASGGGSETPPPSPPPPPSDGGGRGILRKSTSDGAPASVDANPTPASGGRPLEPGVLAFMESRFGRSFEHVRVHTGDQAASAAASVKAAAFTVGQDIVFGRGRYRPHARDGQRLIAHELAHVVQQSGGVRRVSRDEQDRIHQPLIDEYRRRHGQPPGGIDPDTGMQVGPTDAELKYGGALFAPNPPAFRPIRAPAQRPSLNQGRAPWSEAACGRVVPGMPPAQATPIRDCIAHTRFVNAFSQAIANIRAVGTPYGPGLAGIYQAALNAVVAAGQNAPVPQGGSLNFTVNNQTVRVAGSTSIAVPSFTLTLVRRPGGGNGAWGAGGLELNEESNAMLLGRLDDMERTVYHEGVHFLSDIVSGHNRSNPNATPVVPALDQALVRAFQTRFESTVEPFWLEIIVRAGNTPAAQQQTKANAFAGLQWVKVANEFITRVEEVVYMNARSGQGFDESDLLGLAQDWLITPGYWPSVAPFAPPADTEQFLRDPANQTRVRAALLPLAQEIQSAYLRQRPR